MESVRFEAGTIIKGSSLKGCTLCKIISQDMIMRGFQYKIGMNEDINPLVKKGSCTSGLYFTLVKDVLKYLSFGILLAVVTIPDNEDVYVDYGKFRVHRMVIEDVMNLSETSAWEYLNRKGTDIMAGNNYAVKWASEKGFLDVVKYLYEKGADITVSNNYALKWASINGHLDVVKYLYEKGANIMTDDHFAVRWAAQAGHLEVVKYLHEKGADITANNNYAVIQAARYGHFEVVKYLYEKGADITARNNVALRNAAKYGHLDVVKYLYGNGARITVENDFAVGFETSNGFYKKESERRYIWSS